MSNYPSMSLFERFVRFAGVGVIGTAAHYLVLVFLVQFFQVQAVLASSAGALTGALINYILNYHYTFQSNKKHSEAMTKFFVIAVFAFILNAALMYLFTELLLWHYMISQLLTTAFVFVLTFIGNHNWSFR